MLQEYSTWKVAQVFFDEPTKDHYLMEISRKSNLSHTSVKTHLKKLKNHKIITETKEKKGKRTYPIYHSNTNNKNYKHHKKIDLIHRLRNTGLIKHLKDTFMPDCIILFGSTTRGEDAKFSDIDIYLKANKEKINLSKYEKKLNRTIELHINPNFHEYPKELKNNIANGITLEGYLEVIK